MSVERSYFIAGARVALSAKAVRAHWGAVVRHLALCLLKHEKSAKVDIKIKRSKAGWDWRYLVKVLAVGQISANTAL